jgi:hypothetical protein
MSGTQTGIGTSESTQIELFDFPKYFPFDSCRLGPVLKEGLKGASHYSGEGVGG